MTTTAAKTTKGSDLVTVVKSTVTRGERIPAPTADWTPPKFCQNRGCGLLWASCPGHR